MTTSLQKNTCYDSSVEADKLKEEALLLENELAKSELELETLRSDVSDFHKIYMERTEKLYAKLDSINSKISSILSQQNNPREKEVDDTQDWQNEEQKNHSHDFCEEQAGESFTPDTPSDAMKALYRHLAKMIHPDLTTDENERLRRQSIMIEVNKAFRLRDEARLMEILHAWEAGEKIYSATASSPQLNELRKTVEQIKRRIDAIKNEITELKSSKIYQLMIDVEQAKSEGRNLLNEICIYINKEINLALAKLNVLKREV